jgi:sterol desaturase/sphingolipid hydroxylase (fatty acid hydroxylase superfamily)
VLEGSNSCRISLVHSPSHIALSLALSVLVTGLVLVVWLSPELRRWLRGTGSIRQTLSNASVGALFLLSQLFFRGVIIAVFTAVSVHVPWKLPHAHPITFVIAFLLLDAVYYMQHRLEHKVPLLWAIHSVHHQSVDYNWSVSFRVGIFASISTMLFHSLVALAGVDAVTYAAVGTAHAMLLFGLHAQTRFTLGPGRVFNAPIFHRVHHASNDDAIDKNFGGVLLVFDRLFRTFTPYREGLVYGVTDEPVHHNPVVANMAPWVTLFRAAAKKKTLGGKVKALFVRDEEPA